MYYFLRRVVRGQHALVKQMLAEDIELLCKRERVTDSSGRTFDSISGFMYALWALDKHQWDDMLACLPRDGNGHLTEKSRKVVKELKRQYDAVKGSGVIYTLKEVTKKESHYDFALIGELQKHVYACNNVKNFDEIRKQWLKGVGGAQRLCPMHVVDEYCSTTLFGPRMPTFNSRPQPANGLRKFYNSLSKGWESWFRTNPKWGIDFAIVKGKGIYGVVGAQAVDIVGPEEARLDIVAMMALREKRTKNFSMLEAQLNSLLAPAEVASSVFAVEAQHRPGM